MSGEHHSIDTFEAQLSGYVLPANDSDSVRTWLDLVRDIAREEGVDYRDLIAGKRSRSIARARHRAWHALSEYGCYSLNEIAARWGVHWSTVQNAVCKVGAMLEAA